jgi:hypothetical protein
MRPFLRLAALLIVSSGLYALAGCSLLGLDSGDANDFEDVYRYTAFDEGGTIVVTGTLRIEQLPSDVASEPDRLRGSWTLEATSSEVGPQDGQGALAGTLEDTIEGPTFSIDLNPGMADDNVLLNGRIVDEGARLEGTWQHLGFAGPLAAGRFEAVRTREATRRHLAG